MYKLLKANFFKLRKSIVFWLFIFLSAGIAVISHFFKFTHSFATYLDTAVTEYVIILGIFIAFFVSLFVGREYSDGIIRNKIVNGHTRKNIYFSNLIICIIAGILAEVINVFFSYILNVKVLEPLQMRRKRYFLYNNRYNSFNNILCFNLYIYNNDLFRYISICCSLYSCIYCAICV